MAQFAPRIRPNLITRRRPVWRAPVCLHEARRTFASYQRNQAKSGAGERSRMAAQKGQKAQQAVKLQLKDQMAGLRDASKIPMDLGLLPDTFIMPTGKNLPSIFNDIRFRLQLEWLRIRARFRDTVSSYTAYKMQIYSGVPKEIKPPTPSVDRKTIVPAAKRLHKEMYTAFAAGNESILQEICTESILDQYSSRITQRNEKGEKMKWELLDYKTKPRLVSMKCGGTPIKLKDIPVGIQQAVVKIQSLQRLTMGIMTGAGATGPRSVEQGHVVWKESKEKEVTEYLVVQRRLLEGKYEPWKVWGFAKELDAAAAKRKILENKFGSEKLLSDPR